MRIVKQALRCPYTFVVMALLRGPATLRRDSISNEGVRITPPVVLENLTGGRWPASTDRRYLEVLGTHNQLSLCG